MGDFDIDMPDWDIQESINSAMIKKFKEYEDEQFMKSQAKYTEPPKRNFQDLGGFRIFKATNGYIVQVGTHEGSIPTDAYVCKEANEIGNLITAHIVGKALED